MKLLLQEKPTQQEMKEHFELIQSKNLGLKASESLSANFYFVNFEETLFIIKSGEAFLVCVKIKDGPKKK